MARLGWMMVCITLLAGCAQVHQTQLGDIDAQMILNGRRFEIIIDEAGLNVEHAAKLAKFVLTNRQIAEQLARQTGTSAAKILSVNKNTAGAADAVSDIIGLFQMGPRTGNPVFDEEYADALFELLIAECPSGRISGLTSVRETATYPVFSGEVVRIIGYCLPDL